MPNIYVQVEWDSANNKKIFTKTGGSGNTSITPEGNIEVPNNGQLTIFFRPKETSSRFNAVDGNGNLISFNHPFVSAWWSSDGREIEVEDKNRNQAVGDVTIAYALKLDNYPIDPAIINKGTGGIIPKKPKKKVTKKPATRGVAKPATRGVAKPATRGVAKPATRGVAKPATKKVAKPAAKKAAKKSTRK